ncbi:MAG: phage holin family protein [Clostridia bacterium]|nr:phage holin family protein [Clostridia bacterium]
MSIIIKWLLSALSIIISAYLIPGVVVASLWTALIISLVLGLLNLVVKPILLLLTLPVNLLTLGLFTFVINALMVWFTSTIVKGFTVGSFLNALLFSLLLTIIQYLFEIATKK